MRAIVLALLFSVAISPDEDDFCASYFRPCSHCYDGFLEYTSQECIFSENVIDNCLIYEEDGKCRECDPGFAMIDGNCAETSLPNCLYPLTVRSCQICVSGIRNEFGSCGTSRCFIPNCIWCETTRDSFELCTRCEEGYSLDVGRNSCYPSSMKNCKKNFYDVCYQCDYGYYNREGICVVSNRQRRDISTSWISNLVFGLVTSFFMALL